MFAAQVAKVFAHRTVQVEKAHITSALNKLKGSAGFAVPLGIIGMWMVWPAMGPETKASMGFPVEAQAGSVTVYVEDEVDTMPRVKQ
jgi:hypothetical protein